VFKRHTGLDAGTYAETCVYEYIDVFIYVETHAH